MSNKMNVFSNNSMRKNIVLSFSAQIFSLITSFVLGFIVPKVIDELQYAYWQTFVLYVSYAGLLHFGIIDGLILRYSQYDYDNLDKTTIRSQLRVLLAIVSIFCFIGVIISASVADSNANRWITILVSVGIITKNLFAFGSYTFQMTNRIPEYTKAIIIQRVSYAALTIILLFLKTNDFRLLCFAELFGDFAGIVYSILKSSELYFGKFISVKDTLQETFKNITAGVFLLVANLSASLILGGAKMVVNWAWDDIVFGKVSFAFSISSLFLVFTSAVSVVLFPSLKRMDVEALPSLFLRIRRLVSLLLFTAMGFYYPLAFMLERWLPKYSLSLRYLGIILPMVVYSAKISLITDNFMKAYRKERVLFCINVSFVVLGAVLFLISAYSIKSLNALMLSVVFVLMVKSIYSEIYIMRLNDSIVLKDFFIEFFMTVIFILSTSCFGGVIGMFIYFMAVAVFIIMNRMIFLEFLQSFLKRTKKPFL